VIVLIVMLKGGKKYQIKGCAGQGGFAQVYKAYVNSNPDEVVALKVFTIVVFSLLNSD
jgi:predicted RecB family endonuclease